MISQRSGQEREGGVKKVSILSNHTQSAQLLSTSCFQICSQKGSCSATDLCWCSRITATFIFSPLALSRSPSPPSLCLFLHFPSSLHFFPSLLPGGFKKKREGREKNGVWKVGSVKVSVCVSVGREGVNDEEKCNSSRFCATVTPPLSIYTVSLQHSLL